MKRISMLLNRGYASSRLLQPNGTTTVLFLAISFCLGSVTGFCQYSFNLPTMVQPSPNASSLGRYGEIPVSLSSGIPNIDVPLFTVKSAHLSLPISISYHASGIKVTDRSSTVGMGWSLQAGGTITRSMQGVWDEDNNGFFNMIFPDENDPNLSDKEKALALGINVPTYQNSYPFDGQPDVFNYTIGGKSGKFVFKNRVALGLDPDVITIPYSPIIVKFNDVGIAGQPNYIRWGQIQITDTDGTVYVFGTSLQNENALEVTTSSSSNSQPNPNNLPHTTAWHLTNVISPDKSDTIRLSYSAPYTTSTYYTTKTINEDWSFMTGLSQNTAYTTGWQSSSTSSKNLTQIQFKNGKVTLDYSTDLLTLNAIHLFQTSGSLSNELRRFDFTQSYFNNSTTLRLDQVKETGFNNGVVASNPPYVFQYHNYLDNPTYSLQIPPYNSKSQDFWGYYNGVNNSDLLMISLPNYGSSYGMTSLASKRKGNEDYLKVGTIKSIQYPTGGVTTFNFEANKTIRNYTKYDTVFTSLGIHIGNLLDYPTSTFTVTSNLITKTANGTSYNAKITFTADKSCTSNCDANYVLQYILQDLTTNTTLSQYTFSNPNNSNSNISYVTLVTGHQYQFYFPSPGSGNLAYVMNGTLTGNYSYTVTSTPMSETVLTGGLRIKSIVSQDNFGGTLTKQYNYTGSYYNTDQFNGDFDMLALNSFKFDTWGLALQGSQVQAPGEPWLPTQLKTRTYSENLPFPLGSSNNSSLSYSSVEEVELDALGNPLGKTVYNYNVAIDNISAFLPFYRCDKSHIRNQLLSKQVYKYANSVYTLLQEQDNTYTDFSGGSIWSPGSNSVKFYLSHLLYDDDNIYEWHPGWYACLGCNFSAGVFSKVQMFSYYINSSKSVVTSSALTNYDDQGSNPSTTVSTYTYGNLAHMFPTQISKINSEGSVDTKQMIYPPDIDQTSCVNNCDAAFAQSIASQKQTMFSSQIPARNSYYQWVYDAPPPSYSFIYPDSITKYFNLYNQYQANYNASIAGYLTTRAGCLATYNNCVQNFYSAASEQNKAIIDLKTKNVIEPVIQETSYKDSKLLYTTVHNYKSFTSTNTAPTITQFATGSNALENRIEILSYDANGNVTEERKSNDVQVSYLWDYRGALPIAKIDNAGISDVAYTSFESDGTGNWTISSNARVTTSAMTGSNSYSMASGNIIKSGLDLNNSYRVTFWCIPQHSPVQVTVNGVIPTQKQISRGWTLFEAIVSATTITVSGSETIDELRLCPVSSQMSTYTFSPGIGMLSMMDQNQLATYYEYDALGRLQTVRDNNNKILKNYAYHYASAQGDVNSVTSNTILSDNITDPATLGSLTADQLTQSIGYFDGLGRPLQNVVKQGSHQYQDIVTPIVYDDFGREYRKYLPAVTGNDGSYKSGLLDANGNYAGAALNFYNNSSDKIADDPKPFSETKFEPSPLNRVAKQGATGTTWQPDSDLNSTTDRTVKHHYELNGATDVILFKYNVTSGLVTTGTSGQVQYYDANQLQANRTTDEHQNDVIEYVDKLGHTVCKKVQYKTDAQGNKLYACTYYIYDDIGNLVIVLQPEAVEHFLNTLTSQN